uniref:Uncharacterized protein n=1 Tax=Spironucleus salmonicida TaxID=348837 RepID=V6LGF2_9EUKA|eukprot:EST43635.1 Hypothetical protein SS50377_16678 [Spironucleus salmonicida]
MIQKTQNSNYTSKSQNFTKLPEIDSYRCSNLSGINSTNSSLFTISYRYNNGINNKSNFETINELDELLDQQLINDNDIDIGYQSIKELLDWISID